MNYPAASALIFCLIIPVVSTSQTESEDAIVSPPVQLSNVEDSRRILNLLGVEKLRPGTNSSDKNAPNLANL
jgi:hypothetical protein